MLEIFGFTTIASKVQVGCSVRENTGAAVFKPLPSQMPPGVGMVAQPQFRLLTQKIGELAWLKTSGG